MKIILPTNSNHSITYISRNQNPPLPMLLFYKKNIDRDYKSTPITSYILEDGYVTINFTLNVLERDLFNIKILDKDGVNYRGAMMSTGQVPQDFLLTKDLYIYE